MAWPPPLNVREHKVVAWLLFLLVMLGYAAYCVMVLILAIGRRKNPPVSIQYAARDIPLPNVYVCPNAELLLSSFRAELTVSTAAGTFTGATVSGGISQNSTISWPGPSSGHRVQLLQEGNRPVSYGNNTLGEPCFIYNLQSLQLRAGYSGSFAFLALSYRVLGNTTADVIFDESKIIFQYDVERSDAASGAEEGATQKIAQNLLDVFNGSPPAPGSSIPPKPDTSPVPTVASTIPPLTLAPSVPIPSPVHINSSVPVPTPVPSNLASPPLAHSFVASSQTFPPQVAGSFYVPMNMGNNIVMAWSVFNRLKGPEVVKISGQFTASAIRGATQTSRFYAEDQTDVLLVGLQVDQRPNQLVVEKDPLEILTLLSSCGGVWQYVTLLLACIFVSTNSEVVVLKIRGVAKIIGCLQRGYELGGERQDGGEGAKDEESIELSHTYA